jgi:hypothetical protein
MFGQLPQVFLFVQRVLVVLMELVSVSDVNLLYLALINVPRTVDHEKSSTFEVNGPGGFEIVYVDNLTSTGDYFLDTFVIGGIPVDQFQMGLATNGTSIQGVLGIAFDTAEGNADGKFKYPNLVDTMVNESIIATQAYSLWLDDRCKSHCSVIFITVLTILAASTGSLLFGGVDTAKYDGNMANSMYLLNVTFKPMFARVVTSHLTVF